MRRPLLSPDDVLPDLVNDVLDYTKLEADKEAQPVVFALRDMVERAVRQSMGQAARRGLKLELIITPDCTPFGPCRQRDDPAHLAEPDQ